MNRTGFSIGFASVVLYASNTFAVFISTPDDFLLSEDFTLTVPFSTVTTTDTIIFDESGNGWDLLVGVRLLTVNDIFTDLRFFGQLSHDLGGVLGSGSCICPPITNGAAGDSINIWGLSGNTQLVLPHLGTVDIYEYTLSITGVDRSVMGQLSMDANFMLSGKHVAQGVDVPEPSALALLGIGLLGIGFVRRKQAD